MSVVYPLTLPRTPKSYELSMNNIVSASQSIFTGEQYIYPHDGQYWTLQMEFGSHHRGERADLIAMIAALGGQEGTFYFSPLGDESTPRGISTGTPLVKGAGQAGSSTLLTDGWTNSITGILKAGDYISIGDHLYMVLTDANSNGSGEATLDIFPRVRSNTLDNAVITTTNPRGVFRLQTPSQGYSLGVGSIYSGISLSAIENI